jgi:hypothetical protein
MYQPAPKEFAAAQALPVRHAAPHWLLLLTGAIITVVFALGVFYWWYRVCGTCAPPIACAKHCPLNERLRDEMLHEQRLRDQPKLPDRIEQ